MTRLARKIAVPPLGEDRLIRIERAVMAASQDALAARRRPRREARWLPAVAVIATAFAVVAVVALRDRGGPLARALAAPIVTRVVTGPGEHARVELGDAVIALGQASQVAIVRQPDGGVVIELAAGQVDCEVAPRPGRAPFAVVADEVRVTVIGTGFVVARDPEIAVTVRHGMVAVSQPGAATATVAAGQAWRAATGTVTAAATATATASATASATATATASATASATATGAAAPPCTAVPGRTDCEGGLARVADAASVAAVRPKPRHPAGSPHPAGSRLRPPRFAPPEDGALAEIAAVEADDPREAARRFGEIALRETGATASFALYSRLYLLAYRLDQRDAALDAARLYERRFPRGEEAEFAAWIRVGLLCEGGVDDGCRVAAHGYLSRHPGGKFRAEAAAITNR